MFYTLLNYEDFIDSVNKDIDEAIELENSSVIVDVPIELFGQFFLDLKKAGYDYTYPEDRFTDMHRIRISGWYNAS